MSSAGAPPLTSAGEPPPSGSSGGGRRQLPHVISSLESTNFRWLLTSIVAGNTANWVEIMVRSWIVYLMSESVIALGAVHAAKQIPMLVVGLVGGVLADRMDRKFLLVTSQVASAGIAVVLGVLVATGWIEVWHFMAASLLEGVVGAVQQPARQALVPSVVPREHLMNAVALSGSVWTIAKTGGPALAGVAAMIGGNASALFLEAAMYGCGAAALTQVRLHTVDVVSLGGRWAKGPKRGMDWLDGFRGYSYLRTNPVIGWLAILSLVPILFSLAHQTLAPIFAKDVLDIGAGGLGLLFGAPAIGSVIGTLIVASSDDLRRKGLITLWGVVLLGIATALYGSSSVLWLSLLALILHGFAHVAYRTISQTLLQIHTPDEYRGRVMAVWAADRGLHPISTMVIALIAAAWGAPVAVIMSGIGCVIVALMVAAASRTIRELD